MATAFASLPERGQRFALDGLAERDPEVAEGIARLMADPARRAAAEVEGEGQGESYRLPRAVNDTSDDLDWESVTGKGHEPRA